MSLLLNTHAFLWWLVDDPRLSRDVRTAIADGSAMVFVSAASLWEAEIKTVLRRLEFDVDAIDLAEEVAANGFTELAIAARHTRTAATLPHHHSDPFDRMLIAQARVDNLRFVTADRIIGRYRDRAVDVSRSANAASRRRSGRRWRRRGAPMSSQHAGASYAERCTLDAQCARPPSPSTRKVRPRVRGRD